MRTAPTVALLVAAACGGTSSGVDPDSTTSIDATVVADTGPDAPVGPYPIVLAHGLFGFDHLGPLDYFYGISDALTADGRVVYAPRVDAVQSAAVRGAQLVDAIEAFRAQTGAQKVVIIGHSQGGLDARWAAANDPDHVAAVVTVATPHRGSPVADVALGVTTITGTGSTAALDVLADFFGLSTDGSDTDFSGAIDSLSSAGAAAFNETVLDVPGIPYFSIAGRSGYAGASDCPAAAAPFMGTWDSSTDPLKVELVPVAAILAAAALPDTPVQDGLVTVDSAKWGTFLGCVPADHLDEVCQIAGQSPGLGNDFDCLTFWRGLDDYLRSQNL
ncbi:MAG TPA: triacylglycerol lipase [Kofleriaceae bacterium]